MARKTIRRTYRAKTHYIDPTKQKTRTHRVTCSREDGVVCPGESLRTMLCYRDEQANEAGYSTNDTQIVVGNDGHVAFADDDGEGFIYLYPEQVKFLKEILKRV